MFDAMDHYWMQHAMRAADKAQAMGEIPVGAILVQNHRCLAEGYNQVITTCDPTAHAEIMALRQAGQALGNYRCLNTTLYVTLEPCCMCAGALIHARVTRVVFAAPDFKTGAAGSAFELLPHPLHNHGIIVQGGLLGAECGEMLSRFFKVRRQEQKQQKRLLRQ